MEKRGYLVEKQKPKHFRAAGNTDFFGCFDLICVPTINLKDDDLFPSVQMIQVRSRKQYGKEKEAVQEFVNTTRGGIRSFIVWPVQDPADKRKKAWEFQEISPKA